MPNRFFYTADAYTHTDSEFLKSENNQNRDAGSTASTAILVGDRLLVANVGDSRAVICRGGNGKASSCMFCIINTNYVISCLQCIIYTVSHEFDFLKPEEIIIVMVVKWFWKFLYDVIGSPIIFCLILTIIVSPLRCFVSK